MTTQAIREDVESEVSRFVVLVHETFDPERYPRLADGREFDRRCVELETQLAALTRLFHDYLMAAWSVEIKTRLDRV